MAEDVIIPVGYDDLTKLKPDEKIIATRGPRRFVKVVPTPFGAKPAIWTKLPQEETIEGRTMRAVCCVVLLEKDPVQTACITVPCDFYEKLPEMPIEW